MNWVDKLIIEYEQGRKELRDMHEQLGSDEISKEDKKQINSMIDSMTYSVDWMKTGREPDTYRGADKWGAYQRHFIEDMDIYPSLDVFPQEERELTEEERRAITSMLLRLSPRERQCYILRTAYLWKFEEIAKELGITKQTAHQYHTKAEKKLRG